MDDTTLLRTVGEAAYGQNFKQALAQRLVVAERSLRSWLAGERLPPGVRGELAQIAHEASADLARRTEMVQRALLVFSGDSIQRRLRAVGAQIKITAPNDTVLTDFEVIPTGVWDDPEIRFKHDSDLVFATVTQEAYEDFFQPDRSHNLTSNEARLLAQANLNTLAPIIAQHYLASTNIYLMPRAGRQYALVTLDESDLRRAGPLDRSALTGPRGIPRMV